VNVALSSLTLTEAARGYARDAIDTGWISGTGPYIRRFEEALARRVDRRHAIAVSSGTCALALALHGLEIGLGDEVVVPALTFIAPVAMVRAVGATPVFADIDETTWTLDPEQVARLVSPRTRAILAVDVLGHPCDYDRLARLGPMVIEDAAEAHGAAYRGRAAGSLGRVSIFSFHANKAIATGEGGCVVTDDDALHDRMRLLANHGMSAERPYWHPVVGHNFRMTNVTAAIGLGQVEHWDELIDGRRQTAAGYDERLRSRGLEMLGLTRRPVALWARESCWLYTVMHAHRESVLGHLRSRGVDARSIWPTAPQQLPYREFARGSYPVAERISRSAMWLPTWASMAENILDRVVDEVAAGLETVPRGVPIASGGSQG